MHRFAEFSDGSLSTDRHILAKIYKANAATASELVHELAAWNITNAQKPWQHGLLPAHKYYDIKRRKDNVS